MSALALKLQLLPNKLISSAFMVLRCLNEESWKQLKCKYRYFTFMKITVKAGRFLRDIWHVSYVKVSCITVKCLNTHTLHIKLWNALWCDEARRGAKQEELKHKKGNCKRDSKNDKTILKRPTLFWAETGSNLESFCFVEIYGKYDV